MIPPKTSNEIPLTAIPGTLLPQFYSILVIGSMGAGKTRLTVEAAADPRIKHAAVVDFDHGLASVRRGRDKITVYPVPRFDANGNSLGFFKSIEEARKKIVAGVRQGVYDLVVLDPITMAAKLSLDDIRESTVRTALEAGRVPPKIEWGEYGLNTSTIGTLIRQFKALPCHLFVTAMLDRDQDDATKVITYGPDLTKKLSTELPGHFDIVVYLHKEEVTINGKKGMQRILRCRPSKMYDARDRYDALPEEIVNPTMSQVFDYLDKATSTDLE